MSQTPTVSSFRKIYFALDLHSLTQHQSTVSGSECCMHCLSPLPNSPHPVLSFRPSLKEVWNSECVLSSHYFYLFPDFTYFLTILLSRVSSRMHRGLPGISDTCQIYMTFLSFIAGKQYNFSFQNQYILPLPTNYHS